MFEVGSIVKLKNKSSNMENQITGIVTGDCTKSGYIKVEYSKPVKARECKDTITGGLIHFSMLEKA